MLVLCNTQQNLIWNYAQSVSDGRQCACVCVWMHTSNAIVHRRSTYCYSLFMFCQRKNELNNFQRGHADADGTEVEDESVGLKVAYNSIYTCIEQVYLHTKWNYVFHSIISFVGMNTINYVVRIRSYVYVWILNSGLSEWRTKCVRCTKQMLNIYSTTTLARSQIFKLWLKCFKSICVDEIHKSWHATWSR